MSMRKLFLFLMVAALCLGRSAFSQVNGVEVGGGATAQVLGGKSPSVKVTDPEGKELASIPIEKDAGAFIYSRSADTLYVVHEGKKGAHYISAVNLTTHQVDKRIDIPSGGVDLFLSDSGKRLYCFTAGHAGGMRQNGPIPGSYWQDYLNPPYEPAITVIDTASNQIIANYDWYKDFRAKVNYKHDWSFINQFIAASDDGTLVIKSKATGRGGTGSLVEQFLVFSGTNPHPVFTIDTTGQVVGSMLSKDEKLVFATVAGDKKTDGSVIVVDLAKGTSSAQTLPDHPTRLFRLGKNQDLWIMSGQQMLSLSETGVLGERRIQLNKPRKGEEGAASGTSAMLDGTPGETIPLGEDHAAIQIIGKHKVALLDLKKQQVDAIIPTMTNAQKTKIRTGRIAEAILLTVAVTALTAGAGVSVMFIPNMALSNEALAANPDGRFLFALDLEAHEVTVIDVKTATVVKRIKVNDSVSKLQVSKDGKHLICFGSKKGTQQINLETNNLEN